MMYADDYDDQIVPWLIGDQTGTLWPGLLAPYVRNRHVFSCPSYSEGKMRGILTSLGCGFIMDPPYVPFGYEPDGAEYGIAQPGVCGRGTPDCPRYAWPGSGWSADGSRTWVFRRRDDVIRPAETNIISDGFTVRIPTLFMGQPVAIAWANCGWGMHFEGQNLIFLDGHAKFVPGDPQKVVFQDEYGAWNARYYSWDR
jgi:hypothetical protein